MSWESLKRVSLLLALCTRLITGAGGRDLFSLVLLLCCLSFEEQPRMMSMWDVCVCVFKTFQPCSCVSTKSPE